MAEQRFDRLPADAGLFMQVWADTFLTELETSLDDIETSQASLTAQLALITAARKEDARTASYPSSSAILSAADVGTTATITVAAHTRIYPGADIADVAITSGTVTLLAFSTLYYVFYDDVGLTNTAPTFQATTTAATAQVGAAAGRHYLGSVTTPADGGVPSAGGGYTPPGGTQLP